MRTADVRDTNTVIETAAMWVARLGSRDTTPEDQREFETWVSSNPEHAAAYEEMRSLWSDLARVPRSVGRKRSWGATSGALSVLIVALGIYGADRAGFIDRLRADYYAPVGGREIVALADGSRLTLNTDTAVQVRFSAHERRIVILRGEAFFDVAPDASRPFIVDGYRSDAMAVGTHYAVRVGGEDSVAVEEGHVAVSSSNRKVVLGAGEVASIKRGGEIVSGAADIDGLTSWRDGKLVFSGRRLADVLDELGRYQHGVVVVVGSELRDLKVSGTFDTANVEQSIRSLQDIVPIIVDRVPGVVTIVRSK
ncbi:FecR family protein [Rhizobium sp. BG4]|uniref:FecR family protein n=1 Tax=Rhizobium sp. BG4 TaxID=2613770 RepID=UPI00193D1B82|nr:FecR family protein [Rhizobium sp. BG4]QRM45764.1 FecR family protein [Rhizobium sp. BG4]